MPGIALQNVGGGFEEEVREITILSNGNGARPTNHRRDANK
jgi:hypothetical protein